MGSRGLALHVIDRIVDRAFIEGDVVVECEELGYKFVMQNGMVDLTYLAQLGHVGFKFLVERRARRSVGGTAMLVRDLLFELHLACERPSRWRSLREVGGSLYRSILLSLQDQLEVSTHEPWWTATSCLDLAPSRCLQRHRVMSNAYKEAVLQATRETDEPISVRQLFGADRILRAAKIGESVPTVGRAAARAIRHDAMKYLAVGRQVFKNPASMHYTIDGVTAGGDNQNVFFVLLTQNTT